MKPSEARTRIQNIARKLPKCIRQAEIRVNARAKKGVIALSSGPYKLITLRKMGHPYSAARPNPPADPAIINVQTGNFRRSWSVKTGSFNGGTMRSFVINDSPEAGFLMAGGSADSRMMQRPIKNAVKIFIRSYRIGYIREGIREAFK